MDFGETYAVFLGVGFPLKIHTRTEGSGMVLQGDAVFFFILPWANLKEPGIVGSKSVSDFPLLE